MTNIIFYFMSRLILGSNNTIGINSIILNLIDQDILTQSYLIKGLSNFKKKFK